ncbi:hypothetical protein GP486_004581 [Trichoglossum hirsutum]|uniref:DNA polymerase delta subunit 3 n=1 Tax=Trichoglossum hirsutum TaxID=265104 RepID=A0A9P8LAR1_9PEZI|nr:hypothetical protein GP486_004581 [Trichoglossum hirsutum]
MAAKYKEYLASAIICDHSIVTYRALSRALKIHVNTAKELLYEFHRERSSKEPGSIHATYLLTGIRQTSGEGGTAGEEDGKITHDGSFQSSPFMSSSMPTQDASDGKSLFKSVMIVHENELEDAKALHVGTVSIHIYSLEPSRVENLRVLEDVNRETLIKYINEDPLEAGATYGTIRNPNVRSIHTQVSSAASRGSATIEKMQSTSGDNEAGSANPTAAENESTQTKSGARKPIPLKRGQSDIFKSFAKSKPKLHKEDTGSSIAASISAIESAPQSEPEDEPMKDASEEEDDDFVMSTKESSSRKLDGRKSIAERQAELRRMMEDDDEPMEDSRDVTMESLQESTETRPSEPQEPEVAGIHIVSSGGGRRRGRRKVMKKKTVKDEEGYLVTREEPVWESFSEAEPEPPKPKTPTPAASSAGPSKSRKSTGKQGHGNIMSFFGKK